jgi:VanZ family protein
VEDVRLRRWIWTWLPLLLYAGGVTWLSSQPSTELPAQTFAFEDKLVHMTIYALFGALAARAALRSELGRWAFLLYLTCVAYGLFDEWYQQFTPGRSSDLLDALADAIGAGAGFALVLRYHRARHVSRHSPLR